MLKKVLVLLVLFMTAICIFGIYSKFTDSRPQSQFGDKGEQIKKSSQLPPEKDKPLHPVIVEINQRNAELKSFACEDIDIKVWQAGHRFRLNGRLHYQKPRNFHMEISSILGKEAKVGSNDNAFWYWSKRDRNPGLYWANHDDFQKTRLKTPFNPMLLKSSLGQEILQKENARIVENPKDIMVVYPQQSATGNPILLSVFINKDRKQIDGFVVTDMNGKYLAACEIQERTGNLPKAVLYTWYEEDRVMLMRFNNPQANVGVSQSHFVMPNISPKINMGEQ